MKKLNPKTKKKSTQGFTLIELLTVIAIIGILAGIAIPGGSLVLEKAKKMSASANIRNVAQTYNMLLNEGKTISRVNSTNDWAVEFAKKTGLNDGTLYYLNEPEGMNPEIIDTRKRPLSDGISRMSGIDAPQYDVVAELPRNLSRKEHVPLIWTTGIKHRSDTMWDLESPWEGKGGHVAFLSGKVEWIEDTTDNFIDFRSRKKADKISNALPSGALVVSPKSRSTGGSSNVETQGFDGLKSEGRGANAM